MSQWVWKQALPLYYVLLLFLRLCESTKSIKELGLDVEKPSWVDMLIKCRLLGRSSRGMSILRVQDILPWTFWRKIVTFLAKFSTSTNSL